MNAIQAHLTKPEDSLSAIQMHWILGMYGLAPPLHMIIIQLLRPIPSHYTCAERLRVVVGAPGDTTPINLDSANECGKTLAYEAAKYGKLGLLQDLFARGADLGKASIQPRDFMEVETEGATPLHAAAERDQVECLRFILEVTGGDVTKVDYKGNTALHFATTGMADRSDLPWAPGAHDKCILQLLEAKADPDVKNGGGVTAAHFAALGGYSSNLRVSCPGGLESDALDILLDYGADLGIKMHDGRTVRDVCLNHEHNAGIQICRPTVEKLENADKLLANALISRGISETTARGWIVRDSARQVDNQNSATSPRTTSSTDPGIITTDYYSNIADLPHIFNFNMID